MKTGKKENQTGIFRFEIKQYKNSVIAWSISLPVIAFFMLFMFIPMLTESASSMSSLLDSPFIKAMGIHPELFSSTLGVYAYVLSFLMIAGAIQTINLGLGIITKEHMQNTADFLMTKPYTRSSVYFSKLLASGFCLLMTTIGFFIASLGAIILSSSTDFSFSLFFQLFLIFPLTQLFFLMLGIAIGVFVSRIGSTLPLALGISFGFYVIGMFSSVMRSGIIRAFSPLKYFSTNSILSNSGYEPGWLTLYLALVVFFFIASFVGFVRKDMEMVL